MFNGKRLLVLLLVVSALLLAACINEKPPPISKNTEVGAVPDAPSKSGIVGEFALVRTSRNLPDPTTGGVKTHYDYHRAFVTEDEELMMVDAPGKKSDDGQSVIMSVFVGEDWLVIRTYYIMDLEFNVEFESGSIINARRGEDIYLPEARTTIRVIYFEEKVRMTGTVKEGHILKPLKTFSVSTIEKID